MVVVELGAIEDAAERERYLEFLAANEIAFVRAGDEYSAEITLVKDKGPSSPPGSAKRRMQKLRSTMETSLAHSGKCEPKQRSSKWLLGLINDIYEEMAHSEENRRKKGGFPSFVMEHLSKRYGLKQIMDQMARDLAFNLEEQRSQKLEVEVFARFLSEYYDSEDLDFFLKARHFAEVLIQKSVKRSKWAKEFRKASPSCLASSSKSDVQVYLKWFEVEQLARHLYGSRGSEKRAEFLSLVDENCIALQEVVSDRVIEFSQLLHLCVAQFHDVRKEEEEELQEEDEGVVAPLVAGASVGSDLARDARAGYEDKLKELGFEREPNYEQRLSDMVESIRDTLDVEDSSQAEIEDWAQEIIARQDEEEEATRSRGFRSNSEPLESKPLIEPERQHSFSMLDDVEVDPKLLFQGPSPPTSPRPLPPPSPWSDDFLEEDAEELDEEKELEQDKAELVTHSDEAKSLLPMPPRREPPSAKVSPAPPLVLRATSQPQFSKQQSPSTEGVLRGIYACLNRSKEAYLSSLLSTANTLPQTVVFEIEQEIRERLDRKAKKVLNDVIGGGRGRNFDDLPMSSSYSSLSLEFKSILRARRVSRESTFETMKQIERFCDSLLHATEVRQEIEPLVALLVTYAKARLGTS